MKVKKQFMAFVLSIVMVVALLSPLSMNKAYAEVPAVDISETAIELIQNGDFSEGGTGWGVNTNENHLFTFEEGKAVATVTGGAISLDWMPSLYQTVSMEAGKNYKISVEVESSVDRNILVGQDNGRSYLCPADQRALKANEKKLISYETGVLTQAIAEFKLMIYCGQMEEDQEAPYYGDHTVTITKVSVQPLVSEVPGEDPGTNEPIPDVVGNLVVDGMFNTTTNIPGTSDQPGFWFAFGEPSVVDHKAIFNVPGGIPNGWEVSLGQNGIPLKAGNNYRVSFTVESSIPRNVKALMDNAQAYNTVQTVPANTEYEFVWETGAMTTDLSARFMIFLGKMDGVDAYPPHTVKISKVSIVSLGEAPIQLPDDANDPITEPIQDITGITPSDAILLKNGDFSQGLDGWQHYEVDWMQTYNIVKYNPVENGMQVYIEKVGGDPGNNAWDVQLFQQVTLKQGLEYTISFDVHSDKARSIQMKLEKTAQDYLLLKNIAIQDNETRHVSFNVPVQEADLTTKFFIFMGKVNGEVEKNNLTFSNMKIEVNGYREKAVLIQDGNFSAGLGSFTTVGEKATFDAASKPRLAVEVTEATTEAEVKLQRSNLDFVAGQTYEIRLSAGAVDPRVIKATIMGGATKAWEQSVSLTRDVKATILEFTPAENISGATLEFLLGGEPNSLFFDNIRVDVKGMVDALGINTTAHDITDIMIQAAPVISEDVTDNVTGNHVELTFSDHVDYRNAINSILVSGVEVIEQCTIEAGKLTLPGSLFVLADGVSQDTYTITIKADWYQDVVINQVIYKELQWRLTWNDEFDGTTLDASKWAYQNGTGAEYGIDGWGNNEQQYYSDNNITVDNGLLTIEARKESVGGKPYTSGRIWTLGGDKNQPLFAQQYGKFEAKIKLPAGQEHDGLWPAFWMLPADSPYGGWATSGEIDIMEARGRIPNKVGAAIHYGEPWPNNRSNGGEYSFAEGSDITDFHVYGLEWDPGEIRWYVDGQLYYSTNNWYAKGAGQPSNYPYPAPFDTQFYIILNLAVGGNFDGGRIPSDSVLPAQMQVDYVRAYEYLGEYEEPVEPQIPKEDIPASAKQPDANGNYIIDEDFEDVTVVNSGSIAQDPEGWNFLTLPDFQGAATLTTEDIEGSTFANVDITNVGNQSYSVQLIQNVPLVKGRFYQLSFDAKASGNRTMAVKVGDTGDNGWIVYSAQDVNLTTDINHYTYSFQMTNNTDLTSRVEFNMGLNNKSVGIANVVLKEIDGIAIDDDITKVPLEDGNHVYNGAFDIGSQDRMTYWHCDGTVGEVVYHNGSYRFHAVTNDAVEANAQKLYQKGLELLQDDTYQIQFNAYVTQARELIVKLTNADGTQVYGSATATLDTNPSAKSVTITMPEVTDKQGRIEFWLGGAEGEIYLDNVNVTRTTNNNVDYSNLNCYPLNNGDFSDGLTGWSMYQAPINYDNGTLKATVTAGGAIWDRLVAYGNMDMHAGYEYEFSFDAKATANVTADITFEDAGYARSFELANVGISNDWQHYSYTFKITQDKNLSLKFLLGGEAANYDFYLDNVVLQIKGAPKKAATIANKFNIVNLGQNVELTHNGDAEWTAAITNVLVNGTAVDFNKVTITADTIILDKSLFLEIGSYSIQVKASGYSASNTVTQKIYPADGNRILNGDFSEGLTNFITWAKDGCADFNTDNGYLDILSKFMAYDGPTPITWSIQLKQENIPVTPGKEYQLRFEGYSTINRTIIIEGLNNAQIDLTTENKVYTVNYTPNSELLIINFLMGTIGDLENVEHHIYLDNISFKEVVDPGEDPGEEPEKLVAPTSVTLTAPADGSIQIEITPAANAPEGVSYEIYLGDILKDTIDANSYTITELNYGTYTILVKAICEGYEASDAKTASITLKDMIEPSAPTNVRAVSTASNTIQVNFNAASDNVAVVGYNIYLNGVKRKDTSVTNALFTQIAAGNYTVAVEAYDAEGNVSTKTTANVTVNNPTPTQPTPTPVTPTPTPAPEPGIGEDGITGWDAIQEEIQNQADSDEDDQEQEEEPILLEINMASHTALPGGVISSLRGKNVNLLLQMNENYSWLIHGNSIQEDEEIGDIDLGISEIEEDDKLDKALSELAKDLDKSLEDMNIATEFEISHNGALPFAATLRLYVGKEYIGKSLYLNYFNEDTNQFELFGKYSVDENGFITMEFSHASKYLLAEENIVAPEVISRVTLYEDNTYELKPSNILSDAKVTYKSSEKSVATIDKNGRITPIKAGKTTITTIIEQEDKKYSFTTVVTVKEIVFKFIKKTSSIKVGTEYTYKVKTVGIVDDVIWSTSDKKVATVSKSGILTAKKKGTVTVYATADGLTISCKVTIKQDNELM